jgi:RNA polymerase subunit RPABC4/transcription elongation factor Spt4
MPSYKHPCPYCGKFIDKIAAACPYCGRPDPFAPRRCPNCDKIVDDPAWVACPSCGASLLVTTAPEDAAAPGSAESPAQASSQPSAQPAAPPPPPPSAAEAAPPSKPAEPEPPVAGARCSGCGAPLAEGARFCTTCGTMAG